MNPVIAHLISFAIGFILGVLVGHNNKPLVDSAIAVESGLKARSGVGGAGTPPTAKPV